MKERFVLAIDQGTTGTTALLLDAKGEVRGRGYSELPQHFPQPGWVEHDGDEIWSSRCCTRSCARARRRRGARSRRSGSRTSARRRWCGSGRPARPLARAIVWQDRRTAAPVRGAARAPGTSARSARRPGSRSIPTSRAPSSSGCSTNVPGVAGARAAPASSRSARSTRGCCGSSPAARCTRPTSRTRRARCCSTSRAARWDDGLCELFGVPRAMLPMVRPSCGVFGHTRERARPCPTGSRSPGIAGDQQAALFGQGCVAPGPVEEYVRHRLLPAAAHRRASRSRRASGLLTTVACDVAGEPGIRARRQRVHRGRRDPVAARRARASWTLRPIAKSWRASVDDSGGVVLVPAFVGLGAPHWRRRRARRDLRPHARHDAARTWCARRSSRSRSRAATSWTRWCATRLGARRQDSHAARRRRCGGERSS